MATSWQQQLKKALSGHNTAAIQSQPNYSEAAAKLFKTVVTEEVTLAIKNEPSSDVLLRQFMPMAAETVHHPEFKLDPVGDHDALARQGIIHKYYGRVLVIASGSCAVNCRYCFRRHFPYQQQLGARQKWKSLITYLKQQPEIHEVILSGGDPLTLTTEHLRRLTDQLRTLDSITTLRIHSRIPTVLPERIDDNLLDWLTQLPLQKVLVTHINHSLEITPAAALALNKITQTGTTLLNQSVLLKSVNDDVEVLSELSHNLFKHGILPYYLHVLDRVQNAAHFEVDIATAGQIYSKLQARLPGYLLPKMVQEVAGQSSKSPVNVKPE